MGMVRNRTHTQALQTSEAACSLAAYGEIGTISQILYLKNIPKVLQGPLKVMRVDNQNNNYNRLLCFRHDKVSHDY